MTLFVVGWQHSTAPHGVVTWLGPTFVVHMHNLTVALVTLNRLPQLSSVLWRLPVIPIKLSKGTIFFATCTLCL